MEFSSSNACGICWQVAKWRLELLRPYLGFHLAVRASADTQTLLAFRTTNDARG